MWRAEAKNGKVIESDFWDWCLMNVIIENYMADGLTYDEGYKKFWEYVREYDPEDYDLILRDHDGFEGALGDGYLDDIRTDYLYTLEIEAEEIDESLLPQ